MTTCGRSGAPYADGNTFHERTGQDGRTYRVMKNYPSEAELREWLGPVDEIRYWRHTHNWMLSYRLAD